MIGLRRGLRCTPARENRACWGPRTRAASRLTDRSVPALAKNIPPISGFVVGVDWTGAEDFEEFRRHGYARLQETEERGRPPFASRS